MHTRFWVINSDSYRSRSLFLRVNPKIDPPLTKATTDRPKEPIRTCFWAFLMPLRPPPTHVSVSPGLRGFAHSGATVLLHRPVDWGEMSSSEDLIKASRAGDYDGAVDLLRQGEDVNQVFY